MDWTDERIERLKQLAAEGLGARQIAAELGGVTRNAVIGKLHRLKRVGAPPRQVKPVLQKPDLPPRPKAQRLTASSAPAAASQTATAPLAQARTSREDRDGFTLDEAPGAATFQTLGGHMCRWPIGDPATADFSFCGEGQTMGSYCARHAQLAFRPPPTRQQQTREFRRLMSL